MKKLLLILSLVLLGAPRLHAVTATITASSSATPTPTATDTVTDTKTTTPTDTATATFTATPSLTITKTGTRTDTPTRTPTSTVTPTFSVTFTQTPTKTITGTSTFTMSPTRTVSPTFSRTPSITLTSTPTKTPTLTLTSTPLATVPIPRVEVMQPNGTPVPVPNVFKPVLSKNVAGAGGAVWAPPLTKKARFLGFTVMGSVAGDYVLLDNGNTIYAFSLASNVPMVSPPLGNGILGSANGMTFTVRGPALTATPNAITGTFFGTEE